MKIYVQGIKLVGGRFDLVSGLLDQSRVRELESSMPSLSLTVDYRSQQRIDHYNADSVGIKIEADPLPLVGTAKGYYLYDTLDQLRE